MTRRRLELHERGPGPLLRDFSACGGRGKPATRPGDETCGEKGTSCGESLPGSFVGRLRFGGAFMGTSIQTAGKLAPDLKSAWLSDAPRLVGVRSLARSLRILLGGGSVRGTTGTATGE